MEIWDLYKKYMTVYFWFLFQVGNPDLKSILTLDTCKKIQFTPLFVKAGLLQMRVVKEVCKMETNIKQHGQIK